MKEYVNLQTGEIVSSSSPRTRVRVASSREAVGLDTKYPVDCTNPEQLEKALKNLDANLHFKPDIDHAYLMDSVMQKLLTVSEAQALTMIGRGLSGWNYWFGTKGSFAGIVSDKNFSRLLSSLSDKRAIRVQKMDTPFRGDLVIQINPVIAFKGSNYFRNGGIEQWYRPIPEPRGKSSRL